MPPMGQTSDDAWPCKSDPVPQGVVPPRLTQISSACRMQRFFSLHSRYNC